MLACVLLASGLLGGCGKEGCLDGREGCEVPSPCQQLAFVCEAGTASARLITEAMLDEGQLPGGLQAEGGAGDVLLENDRVQIVIEALEHPHYLGPTGGNLIDIETRGDDNAGLAHIFVATGILPGDAVFYERLEILDEGPELAAVQVIGHLEGRPEIRVATRYELRPCDPGVRMRTEMINLSTEPALLPIYDSFWWGGRQTQPFIPAAGVGFDQPPLDLEDFDEIAHTFPFMAAATQTERSISHAITGCNIDALEGVNSDEISAVGLARRIVSPRDYRIYERFLAVGAGRAVAASADAVAEARAQLFDEAWATLSGEILFDDARPAGGEEALISIHLTELDAAGEEIPRTQVIPDESGAYAVRLAPDRRYRIDARSFGRVVASAEVKLEAEGSAAPALTVPRPAIVTLSGEVDGEPHEMQVFFRPADDETREAVTGRLNNRFDRCAPLLGSPTGPSPACDRALIPRGESVAIPAPAEGGGRYWLYATVGPFATLAREEIELSPGDELSVHFELERLEVPPEGSLSADFHVHGGQSFDGSLPDLDRVRSFLAASIDAIAATDHEVIHDYADALDALDAGDRLAVMPGTETTGFILFLDVPYETIPKVVGHFNFWPLRFDPHLPSGGAPWSQLAEPGEIFERMQPRFRGEPVIQLNHPWGGSLAGRDYGFPRALGVDSTADLTAGDEDSPEGMFRRVPECGPGAYLTGCEEVTTSNLDYHVQEVMNGTDNSRFLAYRALWFALLDQGIVRAGTANSDTHTLVDNVIGSPRNVVSAETRAGDFDADVLNAAVRAGRLQGTNGPILEVSTTDAGGEPRAPSTTSFVPGEDAELAIRVRAAPWVPVDEVRVYVNGELAHTIENLIAPEDPFGTERLLRLDTSLPLSELLPPGDDDAYIVVEAGDPLPLAADLNGDGIPDTGDNTGDGRVTLDDVPADRRDGCFRCEDRPDHWRCRAGRPGSSPHSCGPLRDPEPPSEPSDPRFHFEVVTPGGYPLAFTNPLLLDRNGSDRFDGPRGGAGE